MPPILYYFNPGHETAILNGSPYYMAPANVAKMQNDLSFLPAWIGTSNDFVLLESQLPDDFTDTLISNNIQISKGIPPTLLQSRSSNLELDCHIWGMSPQAIHHIEEIKSKYNFNINIPKWKDELRNLSSRQTNQECLTELIKITPEISSNIIPTFYSDLDSLENAVKEANHQLLAKAPFSSSGRGLLWLPVEGITRTEKQIIHGILKKQGVISLERVLDKKIDFAMEFMISEDGMINFLGYSLFNTNQKGSYMSNYLGAQQNILTQISSYVSVELLEKVKANLIEILRTKFKHYYHGCIGVDMMIYSEDDSYKLHPCLEINVRDNMGLLSINIFNNHIHPESEGSFFIDFQSQDTQIHNSHKEMVEKYPIQQKDNKIEEGYLSLCPITDQTKYRAYILIAKREENA